MSEDTVRLTRNGHDPLEIGVSQVTPATLARVFSLDPNTIWLREEIGQRAYFPDGTNSHFEFPTSIGMSYGLIVEGSAQNQGTPTVTTPLPLATPVPSGSSGTGTSYRQLVPVSKKCNTINIKVIQATMRRQPNGKFEFNSTGQAFIDVTDSTANVHYITNVVQKRWGTDFQLVTADGLQLEDSSGTQGFKFWKVGSRKIYAVRQGNLKMKSSRKRGPVVISDSDSDDDLRSQTIRKPPPYLTPLVEEVKEMRKDIQCLFQITEKTKVSPGLYRQLRETFQCHICRSTPIVPPVIFARCCRRILGCQTCVDAWYGGEEGMSRTCPMCRFERAYSETTTLRGLDDFLKEVTPLLATDEEQATSDDVDTEQQN